MSLRYTCVVLFQNSYGHTFDIPFQQKYASIVLELDKLNTDLNKYLLGVQQHCQEVRDETAV